MWVSLLPLFSLRWSQPVTPSPNPQGSGSSCKMPGGVHPCPGTGSGDSQAEMPMQGAGCWETRKAGEGCVRVQTPHALVLGPGPRWSRCPGGAEQRWALLPFVGSGFWTNPENRFLNAVAAWRAWRPRNAPHSTGWHGCAAAMGWAGAGGNWAGEGSPGCRWAAPPERSQGCTHWDSHQPPEQRPPQPRGGPIAVPSVGGGSLGGVRTRGRSAETGLGAWACLGGDVRDSRAQVGGWGPACPCAGQG